MNVRLVMCAVNARRFSLSATVKEDLIMPWVQSSESHLKFPHQLWAKIVNSQRFNRDDILDALRVAQKTHHSALDMFTEICELKSENLRLKHENKFMLRLINDRDNDFNGG